MEIDDNRNLVDIDGIPIIYTGSSDEKRSCREPDDVERNEDVSQLPVLQHTPPPHELLPTEIMALIFRKCLDGEPIYLPISYSSSTVTMPWVLGQVCSTWKVILMNHPSLWSTMTLSYETIRDKESFTRRVKELILPRSKFDIMSLTCVNTHAEHNEGTNSAVSMLVMPNLRRFRHLSLSMHRTALEPLITSAPGAIESLDSLELEFLWTPQSTAESFIFYPGSITAFEGAQNLRKVSLKSRYFCDFKGMTALTFPWDQLTVLDLDIFLTIPMVVKFLPHCTQLLDCSLQIWGPASSIPSSMITLPRLRSIVLYSPRSLHFGACQALLQVLIVPRLKSFMIHRDLQDQTLVQEALLKLISHSGCSVEFFEISGSYSNAFGDITFLLEAMPYLRKLVLPYSYFLLPHTMKRMVAGELVPHLEAMHCGIEGLFMAVELLDIRKSGKSPGAPESYRGLRCIVPLDSDIFQCTCQN